MMKQTSVVIVSFALVWSVAVAANRSSGQAEAQTASPAGAQANPRADTGDVASGKRLYTTHGCYQCHGTVGQGGGAGPRLSQTTRTLASFLVFVRNPPPGNMPPYRAKIMSDQELADVYAYIKTFPEPAPRRSIPMLNE